MKNGWIAFSVLLSSPAGLGWAGGPTSAPPHQVGLDEITKRLAHTEVEKRLGIEQFSSIRHYVLRNHHLDHDGDVIVRVTYRKGQGEHFEVIDYKRTEGLCRRILERLMEGEEQSVQMSAGANSVTPDHYDFTLIGTEIQDGRLCYVLELHPKSKSRFLIAGKAWVDAEDFAVVKLEGRPTASLSFWVGKPYIVQKFRRNGDYWMASFNKTLIDSHFFGQSELTIEYSDYELTCAQTPRVATRIEAAH